MNIAKHSKDSSSQRSLKRRFLFWIKTIAPAILLASLLGTYLDLYFVGKGIYSFPKRILPEIFSINITFTVIGLPALVGVFLLVISKLNFWQKASLIFILSMVMSVFEKQAESMGFFLHHDSWKHMYSFGGYILFLTFIYLFHHWCKKG